MSSFVKHQAPARSSAKVALLLGGIWAALLGAIWFAYREGAEPGGFLHFLARFHVLIVHLPIGLIFLALVMDLLSHLRSFAYLHPALPFVLWLSFLGSIGATLAGYLLMTLEDYSGRAMDLHLYFGLAVVVFILLALVFSVKGWRVLSGLGTAGAAFATMASGHFGGAMVHEANYLTQYAPEPLKPALLVGIKHPRHEEPEAPVAEEDKESKPLSDRLVYADFVVPILEKSCNECHNENKTKGKLRMDNFEVLMAGAEGSDFPTVVPGDAEASELIVRVLLNPEDDEFMPPQGDPLHPAEIDLLKRWIQAGAKADTTVAQLGEDPAIAETVAAVAALHSGEKVDLAATHAPSPSIWDTLSPEEQADRLAALNEAAEKYHFSVMPISAEDDRLRINVVNAAKQFGDETLQLLEPVAERIVWLDLARSQVTDQGMKTVGKMANLERLHLENTAITDAGIAELSALSRLEYLNLYGTKVGNGIFATFEKLPKLKKVYVWQTEVDPARAKAFERSVNLEINTGVELASPPPPPAPQEIKVTPAPQEEEKKAPAKPAEPAKAAEAKPAPQAKPANKPAEAKPAPAPAAPAKPAEPAKAAEAKPAPQPKPANKPAEAKPAPAPAAPAKPAEPAKPNEAKPSPALPAEPKPAEPAKATEPGKTDEANPAPQPKA